MASEESGERDMPSRAGDAETAEFIATVKKQLLDLYRLIHPRDGLMKTSYVFDKQIFSCVDYFWEEVREAGKYTWIPLVKTEPIYTWRLKAMDDPTALRIIKVYVRDWLAMAAVHKEQRFGEDIRRQFDAVHKWVTADLDEEEEKVPEQKLKPELLLTKCKEVYKRYCGAKFFESQTGRESDAEFVATVQTCLMWLYQEIHPRGRLTKSSDIFEALILCCVDLFWRYVQESRALERERWAWRPIPMEDSTALRIIKGDVRRWLTRAAVHRENSFRGHVLVLFDALYTYVASWLDEEDRDGPRGEHVPAAAGKGVEGAGLKGLLRKLRELCA